MSFLKFILMPRETRARAPMKSPKKVFGALLSDCFSGVSLRIPVYPLFNVPAALVYDSIHPQIYLVTIQVTFHTCEVMGDSPPVSSGVLRSKEFDMSCGFLRSLSHTQEGGPEQGTDSEAMQNDAVRRYDENPEWFDEPLGNVAFHTGHAFFDGSNSNYEYQERQDSAPRETFDSHDLEMEVDQRSPSYQRLKRRDQLNHAFDRFSGNFDETAWEYLGGANGQTQAWRDNGVKSQTSEQFRRSNSHPLRSPSPVASFGGYELSPLNDFQGERTAYRRPSSPTRQASEDDFGGSYIERRGTPRQWSSLPSHFPRQPHQVDRIGQPSQAYLAPSQNLGTNGSARGRVLSHPGAIPLGLSPMGHSIVEQRYLGRSFFGEQRIFDPQMGNFYGPAPGIRSQIPYAQSGYYDWYNRQFQYPGPFVDQDHPMRAIPGLRVEQGMGGSFSSPLYPGVAPIAPMAAYGHPQGDDFEYIVIPKRALASAQIVQPPLLARRFTTEDFASGRVVLREPMLRTAENQYGFRGPDSKNKKAELYKTELCRSWEETGTCRYGSKCQFAHSEAELRAVERHPKYKTELCKTFWESGTCPYGKRCCFIHTTKDLEKKEDDLQNSRIILKKPEKKRLEDQGGEQAQATSHHGIPIDDERTVNIIGQAGVEELRQQLRELRERERERERQRELAAHVSGVQDATFYGDSMDFA
ncbi:hypothetical protein HDU93_004500 [Gonapodya sp. JEL0774]|nr:hypothetical protein HDU93_004500 [Gonapodya sp. JEL0774]